MTNNTDYQQYQLTTCSKNQLLTSINSTVNLLRVKAEIKFDKEGNPQMISALRISASNYQQVPITSKYQLPITDKYQQYRKWKWKLRSDLAKREILRWFLLSGFLHPSTNPKTPRGWYYGLQCNWRWQNHRKSKVEGKNFDNILWNFIVAS